MRAEVARIGDRERAAVHCLGIELLGARAIRHVLDRLRAAEHFFFSSRRRHTRWNCDWSSDVCSSDLRNLWDVIENLRKGGKTIVITTHYMEEAERLCDIVAVMDMGKIVAQDTPPNLIK